MLLTRNAWDSLLPTACRGAQGPLPDQAVLCLHQPGPVAPRTSIDTQQMDSTLDPEQQRSLVSWEPDPGDVGAKVTFQGLRSIVDPVHSLPGALLQLSQSLPGISAPVLVLQVLLD